MSIAIYLYNKTPPKKNMETFNLSLFKPGIWSPNGITKSKHPLQRSTAKDCFLGKESMQQRGWVPGGHCHPLPSTATATFKGTSKWHGLSMHHQFSSMFHMFFHIFPIELDITWYILEVSRYPSVSIGIPAFSDTTNLQSSGYRWGHVRDGAIFPEATAVTFDRAVSWPTGSPRLLFAYEIPLVFLDVFGVFLEM